MNERERLPALGMCRNSPPMFNVQIFGHGNDCIVSLPHPRYGVFTDTWRRGNAFYVADSRIGVRLPLKTNQRYNFCWEEICNSAPNITTHSGNKDDVAIVTSVKFLIAIAPRIWHCPLQLLFVLLCTKSSATETWHVVYILSVQPVRDMIRGPVLLLSALVFSLGSLVSHPVSVESLWIVLKTKPTTVRVEDVPVEKQQRKIKTFSVDVLQVYVFP